MSNESNIRKTESLNSNSSAITEPKSLFATSGSQVKQGNSKKKKKKYKSKWLHYSQVDELSESLTLPKVDDSEQKFTLKDIPMKREMNPIVIETKRMQTETELFTAEDENDLKILQEKEEKEEEEEEKKVGFLEKVRCGDIISNNFDVQTLGLLEDIADRDEEEKKKRKYPFIPLCCTVIIGFFLGILSSLSLFIPNSAMGQLVESTPTTEPTPFPSRSPVPPTHIPTISPTNFPSRSPTSFPSNSPTKFPTLFPTDSPTDFPTHFPTNSPTPFPTDNPTTFGTAFPSLSPTSYPTFFPSTSPTFYPTLFPSSSPTLFPTQFPTDNPTPFPSANPTQYPTNYPVEDPCFGLDPEAKVCISDTLLILCTDSTEIVNCEEKEDDRFYCRCPPGEPFFRTYGCTRFENIGKCD
eukprot:snap_masked-scaffold_24-processed-gene-5.35-mRNA-1 protein AED:0.55 eAED:0.60 QI:0/-1/0/1/-1/1/1/0/409